MKLAASLRKLSARFLKLLGRMIAIVLIVMAGSTVLVRFAPGYFSDAREMDGRYGNTVRTELSAEATRSRFFAPLLFNEIEGWARGNAGISRQYGIPVLELIPSRLSVTGGLILRSILLAWALAASAALIASAGQNPSFLWQLPATLLIAIPTAAMATIVLLAGHGGPVLVMALLLASRDFKFLNRTLRQAWLHPHLLQARAQGVRPPRLFIAHILPNITSQLSALATLSIVTLLGALVPVEVIFNVPGLGQLAWNAALNRDLPVLLTVTMIMAVAVAGAGMISDHSGDGHSGEWKSV